MKSHDVGASSSSRYKYLATSSSKSTSNNARFKNVVLGAFGATGKGIIDCACIWLADNNPNSVSLFEVKVSGFDTSETVIIDKHFRIEISLGKFHWTILRTFKEFIELHSGICLYDKSAFSRLSNLFPLRYEPFDDPVVVNQLLHSYLVGLVEKIDATLYPPLLVFLKTEELMQKITPQVVVIQKNHRARRIRLVYRQALEEIIKDVRLCEYNKRIRAYPRLWIIANACAMLRQPHCKLTEVHAQMSLADQWYGGDGERDDTESYILRSLPSYSNSSLLVEGRLGAVIFKNGKWKFNQNRVLPMQPNDQYLNMMYDIFSTPHVRTLGSLSPLAKHQKYDNPSNIYVSSEDSHLFTVTSSSNYVTSSLSSPKKPVAVAASVSAKENLTINDLLSKRTTSIDDNNYVDDEFDKNDFKLATTALFLSSGKRDTIITSLNYILANILLSEVVDSLISFEVLLMYADKISSDLRMR